MFGFRTIFLVGAPSEEYLSIWNLKGVKTLAPSHPHEISFLSIELLFKGKLTLSFVNAYEQAYDISGH